MKFVIKIIFTDENDFFLHSSVDHQNDCVRLLARKRCRQKLSGSRKGEICQAHYGLCWSEPW